MTRTISEYMFLLNLLMISSISMLTMASGIDDSGIENSSFDLDRTSIYLKEGMTLSPQAMEATDEYQAISIPNGFVKEGFVGLKIIPVGDVVWKEAGTWYSAPLKKDIILGGTAVGIKEKVGENTGLLLSLLLSISFIVLYLIFRKRKWNVRIDALPPEYRNLGRGDSKRAWKALMKEKRMLMNEDRKRHIIDSDVEGDEIIMERDFSLFKEEVNNRSSPY